MVNAFFDTDDFFGLPAECIIFCFLKSISLQLTVLKIGQYVLYQQ